MNLYIHTYYIHEKVFKCGQQVGVFHIADFIFSNVVNKKKGYFFVAKK